MQAGDALGEAEAAGGSASTFSVRRPRLASSKAVAAPITPAPMITASYRSPMPARSCCPGEAWVVGSDPSRVSGHHRPARRETGGLDARPFSAVARLDRATKTEGGGAPPAASPPRPA